MIDTPVSLLQRLWQPSDREAWNEFVELYSPFLYHWARRLGLNGEDAADLVQEIFVVLVQKLPEFRYDPQKCFRSWLRTVAMNKWRDLLRRRAANERTASPAEQNGVAADAELVFEETEYRRHILNRGMALIRHEFQDQTWQAFWEVAMRDRPASQVATELGQTINAVYLAKSRVIRRLREELEGLLD